MPTTLAHMLELQPCCAIAFPDQLDGRLFGKSIQSGRSPQPDSKPVQMHDKFEIAIVMGAASEPECTVTLQQEVLQRAGQQNHPFVKTVRKVCTKM